MPVYKDKRGRLFIEFQFKGRRVKERLPEGTTEAKADTIEIRLKNKVLDEIHGLAADPVKDITFERFLKEYFDPYSARYSKDTFEKCVVICKAALKMFKGRTMRSIKPKDIDHFIATRQALKTMHDTVRKPATVARELSIISKIFSLAVKNDILQSSPVSKVDKPKFDNEMDLVLEREHQEKFLATLPSQWVKDICIVALHTGLRQGDIMSLTRFNVNFEKRLITLIQGKTKRKVEVACSNSVMEILERRKNQSPMFASPKTGKAGSVRHTMQRTCDKLKIPRISIRDLRRTFATRGVENGFDVTTIADALGHQSLRMALRYVKSVENKRKLADSMENPATIPETPKLRKVK